MSRRMRVGAVVLGLLAGAGAGAEPGYIDTAQVIRVTPVYVTRTFTPGSCRAADIRLGDLNRDDSSMSLREALAPALAESRADSCEARPRQRLAGYDVTLRYAGEQWVQRMTRDPGSSVRVRVGIRPRSERVAADARVSR